jgi:predicted ATPase
MNAVSLAPTSLLRLELRTGLLSSWSRPSNIGYGMTYAFPILVGGLIAPSGSTFIIDSPEAHLHPAAQAAMGRFLAKISASGVQILIETHSDHVMDGVRIAVRDGLLSNNSASFHYFDRTDDGIKITSPKIDSEGKLSEWPRGFFDQHRKNAAKLIRPSGE